MCVFIVSSGIEGSDCLHTMNSLLEQYEKYDFHDNCVFMRHQVLVAQNKIGI